jgi:hypothetical protein
MRSIRIFFFALLLLLNYNFARAEEHWKEYSSFMDRFYYLDKQSFNNISCEVYLSTFNDMLAQTKEQFKCIEDKIYITENISDFKLNLNKEDGLLFVKPSLDVKIISEEGIEDRTKVDSGMEYLRTGFKMYVEGTIHILEGLFGMYISPNSESLKINQISRDDNKFKVVYETNGSHNTDVYSGDRCVSEQISDNIKILIKSEFTAVDNKLITKIADIHIDNAGNIQDVNMIIDYQKIKTIVLPSKIVSKAKIAFPDAQMEGQSEIFLRNCKVD